MAHNPNAFVLNRHQLRVNSITGEQSKVSYVFLFALLSPIIGHLSRKVVPGNPVFLEGISIIPLFFIGVWALSQRRRLPKWVFTPLLLWAFIQMVYGLIGIIQSPMVAISAIGIRIVPMMMAPIAYVCIRTIDDLNKVFRILGVLVLILVPISIYVAIFGDSGLPMLLRPIAYIEGAGLNVLKGMYYTATAVFSVPTQLGFFGFVVFALANLASTNERMRTNRFFIIAVLIGSFIVLFLSGRRILVYFAAIFMFYRFIRGRRHIATLISLLIIIFSALWLARRLPGTKEDVPDRLEYLTYPGSESENISGLISKRISFYFLEKTKEQLAVTPFGTYLGAYGPETRAFMLDRARGEKASAVETGGTFLIAEMGFIGLLGMLGLLLYFSSRCYRRARDSQNRTAVEILILIFLALGMNFLLKDSMFIATNQLHTYFFWAIPGLCISLLEFSR